MSPQPAEPQIPQPVPVPLAWSINPGEVGGQPTLAVQFFHALGTTVLFLDPGSARRLGAQLIENAKVASNPKLIVPQVVPPPDLLHPNGGHP